jgi:hypothetical protein
VNEAAERASRLIAQYRAVVDRDLMPLISQYDWRARWHRRNFRFSGLVVIMLSASLPLLASFDYPHKTVVIGFAGVVIAVATALRTFHHWDQMWGLLRRTYFDLLQAHASWQIELARAEQIGDPDRCASEAYEATKKLFDVLSSIRREESEKFFSSLKFPPYANSG